MKARIKIEKEVDIKMVKIDVAVRYGDEDMRNDFPLRKGDMWSAIIDIDKKKILDWPQGIQGNFYMKICDEGSYFLLDAEGNTVASIENDYVPNSLLPGEYGDYLALDIDEEGIITNWKSSISFKDFFDYDN